MSDKKDKDLPDPDELQKMLKDMFGKMGASVTMPGFSQDDMTTQSQGDSSEPREPMKFLILITNRATSKLILIVL